MLLRFPDLETLMLAITSEIVPSSIVRAPVEFGCETDTNGAYLIRSAGTLPRPTEKELKSLGVTWDASPEEIEFRPAACWLATLPVERIRTADINVGDQTPVLFELADSTLLPEMVGEILRLGNDRQGFRMIETDGQTVTLLRVVGPPYYSLLRSLEPQTSGVASPTQPAVRAYIEAASRVWVELGCRHPLAGQIQPVPGELLLIDREGTWRPLSEQPLRDVYEQLTFELPSQSTTSETIDRPARITVPLRLIRGGSDEPTTLWVLTENAARQIEAFVQSSPDEIIARLAFAVVGEVESSTMVLRVRPGRTAPPVLVFEGLSFRSYLRIPNLFLPTGQRVHPPLRRDVVKQMLAPDDSRLVWLDPNDDGHFTPRSIDEGALRPLSDWVDYILDQHHEALDAWQQSHRFDFDDFACPEEERKPSRQQKATKPVQSSPTGQTSDAARPIRQPGVIERLIKRVQPADPQRSARKTPDNVRRLEQELSRLERAFQDDDSPLDAPSRTIQWREMAEVNNRLGRLADASICRLHELWETDSPDPEIVARWFEVELQAARRHSACLLIDDDEQKVTELTLSRLLSVNSPTPSEVGELASCLAFTAATGGAAPIGRQLGRISQFLQRHETLLSARSCWLAWSAIAKLSGGDVLAMARARDRLLQRLHQLGVSPDIDLPAFLRTAHGRTGERFRHVRERIPELHEHVRKWASRNLRLATPKTLHYVDLLFAYAAAQLGESTRCRSLVESAKQGLLDSRDSVHRWLFGAFEFRIAQAEQGKPLAGPLAASHIQKLQDFERTERYKIDRLREHSSLLEPHEALDPYREWKTHRVDAFDRQLNILFDVTDRDVLIDAVKTLFAAKQPIADRAKLVTAALELSPRLGEAFARKVLPHVIPTDRKLRAPIARAALLENGLEVAAAFDQRGLVSQFLDRLRGLLHGQRKADLKTLEALESVLMQSFRGLRRLGMREELARLLEEFAAAIRPGNEDDAEPERLRVQLRMAAGWFYFGKDRGWADIRRARDVLFDGTLLAQGHVGAQKQTQLAVAYVQAIGEAPLEDAFQYWHELFDQLEGIHDANVVNSHYSLKILDIVEALVLTLISEGFTVDKASQRWLDEEEYLIRRRIHADVRQANR